MHRDLAHATDLIAAKYGNALEACDRVRDYAYEITNPWRGRSLDPEAQPADALAVTLFARSFNTH